MKRISASLGLVVVAMSPSACRPIGPSVGLEAPAHRESTKPDGPTRNDRRTAPVTGAEIHASSLVQELAQAGPPPLRLDSPAVTTVLSRHFSSNCRHESRLDLDLICDHYAPDAADDPSPWPDAVLGVDGREIVNIVLRSDGQSLDGWQCRALDQGLTICYDPHRPSRDAERWIRKWSDFFHNAD